MPREVEAAFASIQIADVYAAEILTAVHKKAALNERRFFLQYVWRSRLPPKAGAGKPDALIVFSYCLHAQADTALLVDFQNFHFHHVAFFNDVGDIFHTLFRELGNVHQAITARGQ